MTDTMTRPAAPARGGVGRLAGPRVKATKVAANVVLLVIALLFVLPMAWVLVASFDAEATLSFGLPDAVTTANFSAILTPELTWLPLWNAFVLSAGSGAITVVVAVLAAYPLSRYRMRFGKYFLYSVLFGTCLPITAIMVPVYALFVQLNLLDSLPGTIFFMAATSLPMAIWMTKN